MNHNRFVPDKLRELPSPAELRVDGRALTLSAPNDDLYLLPLYEHDFEDTEELREAGLTDAEVVQSANHDMWIRYPARSDPISLASALNALEGSPRTESADITAYLLKVGTLLREVSIALDKRPTELSIADLAINRRNGKAELVAPYRLETAGEDVADMQKALFKALCEQVLNESATNVFRKKFGISVDRALEELGW